MSDLIPGTIISPWARPVGKLPILSRRQALRGLKPYGPHTPLADSLLGHVTCPCDTCGGTGLHGTYGGMGWRICPTCHGLGETYRVSLDALLALRQQVLDHYPDAAVAGWRPGRPIACPVEEMATGRMIDACARPGHIPAQGELFPGGGDGEDAFLPWEACVGYEPSPPAEAEPPAPPPRQGWWALLKALSSRLHA